MTSKLLTQAMLEPIVVDEGHYMKTQSRKMSAIETILGQIVGFLIAWAAWFVLLPPFGYTASLANSFSLTAIFTVLSIIRGYLWRRLFNWLHAKGVN